MSQTPPTRPQVLQDEVSIQNNERERSLFLSTYSKQSPISRYRLCLISGDDMSTSNSSSKSDTSSSRTSQRDSAYTFSGHDESEDGSIGSHESFVGHSMPPPQKSKKKQKQKPKPKPSFSDRAGEWFICYHVHRNIIFATSPRKRRGDEGAPRSGYQQSMPVPQAPSWAGRYPRELCG